MKNLRGNCVVGQSGGPTSVINAGVLGVIDAAMASSEITGVFGALNGISGILEDRLIDLGQEDPKELERLKFTPSAALGSCRYKLADAVENERDYARILEIFRKYDIRFFFYIGGNDSMDTCNKVSKYLQKAGYGCRVIGIPKTIDNDLVGTDHCPGFGSAAKLIATVCMELKQDTGVYQTPTVNIVEIMGRHAGWLAGSAALAGVNGDAPDLIYLPERNFDLDQFLGDIRQVIEAQNSCLVAVSEGIHYADGTFINNVKTSAQDGFGHVQLGGLGVYLAELVKEKLGYKARGIELSLLQRCSAHIASETDREESYAAGRAAVTFALQGLTDQMVGFACTREGGRYACRAEAFALSDVANAEKTVPAAWINDQGNGVNQAFIDYALPLVQGTAPEECLSALPCFVHLKKIPVSTAQ